MSKSSESIDSRISLNEDRLMDDDAKPISIQLERSKNYIYLPGEYIQGTVHLKPLTMRIPTGIDIVLTCTFKFRKKIGSKNKQSLFKCIIQPDWSADDPFKASFSFEIPENIPSYFKDDAIDGQIEYKIKAFYKVADLPASLYPKTSVPVLIHAKIVREDAKYKTPTINEKEMEMVVPRDIFLPQKKLRKGEQGIVSAKVCIPQTCFLPGDHIPFILDVHHIAPVKQVSGTQVELERIITIRSENIQSVHNTVVQKQILPLICDTDTLASSISSKMPKIPNKIPPTIDCDSNIPISIQYRMRIMINMDMQHLSEDIPIRKRDRAYSVVTKVMGSLEEEDGPTFFYGSTITMELPIVIGTTSNACISPILRSPTDRYSLPTSIMTTNAGELSTLPHINVTSPSSYITEDEKYVQKSKYRFDSDPISRYSSNLILEPAYDFARMADVIHRPPSAPPLNDLVHEDDFHRQTLEEPSPPPYLEDPNTPDTLSTCTS